MEGPLSRDRVRAPAMNKKEEDAHPCLLRTYFYHPDASRRRDSVSCRGYLFMIRAVPTTAAGAAALARGCLRTLDLPRFQL